MLPRFERLHPVGRGVSLTLILAFGLIPGVFSHIQGVVRSAMHRYPAGAVGRGSDHLGKDCWCLISPRYSRLSEGEIEEKK